MAEPTLIEVEALWNKLSEFVRPIGALAVGRNEYQDTQNAKAVLRAALERHSLPGGAEAVEALNTITSTLREIEHAYNKGPQWYTRGESGLRSQVRMWLDKGYAALKVLAASPPPPSVWVDIETAPKGDELFFVYAPPAPEFPDGRQMIVRGSILVTMMGSGTPNHLQFPATHWAPLLPPPPQQEGK